MLDYTDINISRHAAFTTAAIGMLLGLIIFVINYHRFAEADPDPRQSE